MQIFDASGATKERVGFLVPRWSVDPTAYAQGAPHRSLPAAAALVRGGYEVVFFDQEPDLDRVDRRDELRRALEGVRVCFVWMSELTPEVQTRNAILLASMVREWNPEMRTVLGGPLISLGSPDALDLGPPIDDYLRGYGDESCCLYMEAVDGRVPWTSVPGLVHREDGEVVLGPPEKNRRLEPELLDLYFRLDPEPYVQRGGIFGNGENTLVVGTGRGCPKRCSFCYWSTHPPAIHDAKSIVDVVEHLHERTGVRQFHLAELDFFAQKKRPLELAEQWKRRVPDAKWFALCSPIDALRLTAEEWRSIAEGGCGKIELGTETGSPRMLRAIGKRHTADDAVTITERLLSLGIAPMHNFVFGLLGETQEDRDASLDLIRRIHALAPGRIHLTFRFFQPAWGTVMGDEAIARTEGYPMTLAEVLGGRQTYGAVGGRAMGWLDERAERRIKLLSTYYLPIVTSRYRIGSRLRSLAYRGLRALAEMRRRSRIYGLPLEPGLYRRWVGEPLDSTYLA